MDINSLIYFTEAAKELNFTQTAKRLFVSQQNLSNHIARLEEYYDVVLFERKPHLTLTYAGEVLLAYANNFRMDEDNLKIVLSDIKKKEKGVLRIGGSLLRTSAVLPFLAEKFSQKYSNVELQFFHHHSAALEKMLLDGDLDFSIGVNKSSHPSLISSTLFHDGVYIMVSDSLLKKYIAENVENLMERSKKGADIKDFIQIPFYNIRSSRIIEDCFSSAGCTPTFAITSNYPPFLFSGYYSEVAAQIITKAVYFTIRDSIPSSIHVFPIKTSPDFSLNDISFTRHKRKYLSQYAQYFLKITEEYFKELEEQTDV